VDETVGEPVGTGLKVVPTIGEPVGTGLKVVPTSSKPVGTGLQVVPPARSRSGPGRARFLWNFVGPKPTYGLHRGHTWVLGPEPRRGPRPVADASWKVSGPLELEEGSAGFSTTTMRVRGFAPGVPENVTPAAMCSSPGFVFMDSSEATRAACLISASAFFATRRS